MLSITGGITGLFNIFEYENESLKYNIKKKNEDIRNMDYWIIHHLINIYLKNCMISYLVSIWLYL